MFGDFFCPVRDLGVNRGRVPVPDLVREVAPVAPSTPAAPMIPADLVARGCGDHTFISRTRTLRGTGGRADREIIAYACTQEGCGLTVRPGEVSYHALRLALSARDGGQ